MPNGNLPQRQPVIARRFAAFRTIAALMLREMSTRFGRKPGGYIWSILQPLGLIIMLAMAFSLLARNPALGTSFLLFKATGLLVYQMFRGPQQMISKSLNFSRALLAYPGVTWVDAVLARFFLNMLVQVIVMILILTGVVIYEDVNLILNWNMIVGAVLLSALLSLGIGVLTAFLSERFDIFDSIWNIAMSPLMILSGVLYLFDDLPRFAQDILWYNPLIHTVGMMRAGFYSVYHPEYVSIPFVLLVALTSLVVGLILLRRHHRDLLVR